jgi:hypothetical protein
MGGIPSARFLAGIRLACARLAQIRRGASLDLIKARRRTVFSPSQAKILVTDKLGLTGPRLS